MALGGAGGCGAGAGFAGSSTGFAGSSSAGLASRLASGTGRPLGLLASSGLGGCWGCGGSSFGHGDGIVLSQSLNRHEVKIG